MIREREARIQEERLTVIDPLLLRLITLLRATIVVEAEKLNRLNQQGW